jgi:aldose 1-epimerase
MPDNAPQSQPFGLTATGVTAHRIRISSGELEVHVLTLGAALQSVRLAGVGHDLTLGSDHLADYEGEMRYHGTLIAPVVNRLTGGQAPLPGGGVMQTPRNQDGRHSLHSGPGGTHLKNWRIADQGLDFVTLGLELAEGEAGFPGNRQVRARYSVAAPAVLRLEVTATTDAPTLWNAANHSYWNLDGSADYSGHALQVAAQHYLPTDADFLPTGRVAPVAGSDFDFRKPRIFAPGAPMLDNCFCLSGGPRALTPVLWLTGRSGVRMEVATTEAGVQLYDARGARCPGDGLAIECQNWPDAPNHAGFPSIQLLPGQNLCQITEWRFSRSAPDAG